MLINRYLIVAMGIIFIYIPSVMGAVTDNNQTIGFGIKDISEFAVSGTNLNFGNINPVNSPYIIQNGSTVTVRTNHPDWAVQVRAPGDLVSIQYPGESIPLNQLAFKRHNEADYHVLTTTYQNVLTGTAGTSNFDIDYMLNVNYTDAAGDNYNVKLEYQLIDYP